MFERYSKLLELKEMGWTEDDIALLFREVVNKALSYDNYLYSKENADKILTEMLIDLGFSLARKGTYYIKDALKYCLEEGDGYTVLHNNIFDVLQERNNVKYGTLHNSITEVIKLALKKPTPLAREWFHDAIERRGYPKIEEFLVTTYSLMLT